MYCNYYCNFLPSSFSSQSPKDSYSKTSTQHSTQDRHCCSSRASGNHACAWWLNWSRPGFVHIVGRRSCLGLWVLKPFSKLFSWLALKANKILSPYCPQRLLSEMAHSAIYNIYVGTSSLLTRRIELTNQRLFVRSAMAVERPWGRGNDPGQSCTLPSGGAAQKVRACPFLRIRLQIVRTVPKVRKTFGFSEKRKIERAFSFINFGFYQIN